MPTKLTLAQQRALMRALPATRMDAIKKHCQACEMKGEGFKDIMRSIGRVLGPIVKEIGPTVLKELIIPMIKAKMGGSGLKVPGGALRLAGQGRGRGRPKKIKGGACGSCC